MKKHRSGTYRGKLLPSARLEVKSVEVSGEQYVFHTKYNTFLVPDKFVMELAFDGITITHIRVTKHFLFFYFYCQGEVYFVDSHYTRVGSAFKAVE